MTDDAVNAENGNMTKPIIFETIMEVSMLGKSHMIKIGAPGKIFASLNEMDLLFKRIRISLDTIALLKTMMDQAKIVVNKTTKRAVRLTAAYSKLKLNRSHGSQHYREKGTIIDTMNSSTMQGTTMAYIQQRDQLLLNYPVHLRETVQHFNDPSANDVLDAYLERYPPQLARTLIQLAQGDSEDDLS
eukprot:CAMPEP_0176498354 /NCGR_PEP_ID=MMETSP0200_2-20121128/12271_1 /TAXON_ID=947934 /ORGANISM="Chaetoceros sp., Strain GSL56" /LENGTH=186 /DNA_ID=CAMNT_0017896545 /DNA_START=2172 /DNA_END=2732 /DNA_ORIENTATION=-